MQGIRVFTLVGAVTNEVTCIVPSSFVILDIMTRRYPTVNPKYQAFLVEKDEKEVKINILSHNPYGRPHPTPSGAITDLSRFIHSIVKNDGILPIASMGST